MSNAIPNESDLITAKEEIFSIVQGDLEALRFINEHGKYLDAASSLELAKRIKINHMDVTIMGHIPRGALTGELELTILFHVWDRKDCRDPIRQRSTAIPKTMVAKLSFRSRRLLLSYAFFPLRDFLEKYYGKLVRGEIEGDSALRVQSYIEELTTWYEMQMREIL